MTTTTELLADLHTRIRALPAAAAYAIKVWDEPTTTLPELIVIPRNQTPTTLDPGGPAELELEVTIRHNPKTYKQFVRDTDTSDPSGLLGQLYRMEPDDYHIGWAADTPRMPIDGLEGRTRIGYQMTTAATITTTPPTR